MRSMRLWMLFAAAGAFAPMAFAQINERHVVGLHISTLAESLDEHARTDNVVRAKDMFETVLQSKLEGSGIEVVRRDEYVRRAQGAPAARDWLTAGKVQYLLSGEISERYNNQRTLTWRLRDLRSVQQRAGGPLREIGQVEMPLDFANKEESKATLKTATSRVHNRLERALGVRGTREVLVACFQMGYQPKSPSDAETLKHFGVMLPNTVAAYLNAALAERGFRTKGLDSVAVVTLCAGNPRFDDLKRNTDCVITGTMRMYTAVQFELSLIVDVQSVGPVKIEAFKASLREHDVSSLIGKHIADHWKVVEEAQ